MLEKRQTLANTRRWVVKIGSALVTGRGRGLDLQAIAGWAEQIASLRQSGKEIVLVSSGAVAEGMGRLGWQRRPHALHELQAAAAVGQMGLIQAYEANFQRHGLHSAQILLTHDDLSDRLRYLNARSTLSTLLSLGVIPVVNENDTVATDEIRFGDNDTLAALVCNLVVADLLVILTDQAGLFDRDPLSHADAQVIEWGHANDPELLSFAGPSASQLGRGGMTTKIRAARRAARSGTATIITWGGDPEVLHGLARGDNLGTLLLADKEPLAARKQWIASQLKLSGQLQVDDGAERVILTSGSSLLPVGVRTVRGAFARGDVVSCVNSGGKEIARGLVNYSAAETRKIMGQPSSRIRELLGYVDEPELIHRDNLVVI